MEVKRTTAKLLVTKLSSVSEHTRTEALCELRLLTKNDPDIRPIIAEAGAIPYLTETLYSPTLLSQETAAATLLNLSITSRASLISDTSILDALSHTLLHPSSPFATQCAAATLFSLLSDPDFRSLIGHKRDIVFALIQLIKTPDSGPRTIKDALKALFGVSLCASNRPTMVQLGVVPPLFSLVVKDGRVGLAEDATAVIAQIAGCEESVEAFNRVFGVGVLVDLLDSSTGCSNRIKENAVSALLNLVNCGGDEVKTHVREMGLRVFEGIGDVAENGTAKGKAKAVQLLEVLGGAWSNNGSQHAPRLSESS